MSFIKSPQAPITAVTFLAAVRGTVTTSTTSTTFASWLTFLTLLLSVNHCLLNYLICRAINLMFIFLLNYKLKIVFISYFFQKIEFNFFGHLCFNMWIFITDIIISVVIYIYTCTAVNIYTSVIVIVIIIKHGWSKSNNVLWYIVLLIIVIIIIVLSLLFHYELLDYW